MACFPFCPHCAFVDVVRWMRMVEATLHRMEIKMSQEVDALNEIKAKLEDVHADVKARLDVVAGELSAEGRAEVERIKDALDSFDAEVGDADGSDEQPPANG